MKEKILTVTIHDCEVQTFRAGGKGGQNQNKRDTGVRIIHHPSGARGESREERSQLQNKKTAWKRMAETPEFRYWVAVETGRIEEAAKWLAKMLKPENIKTEVRENGKWVPYEDN
jgi:hypothetical protein